MGDGLPGGASLMEDYTYDLVPGSERILGAHMLEVSPALTTTRPRLEVHPLGIGGREDPVRLVFTADPGAALVVALIDLRDRFRFVANVVENVTAPDLPNLPVGRAVWRPAPDFPTSTACWLAAGGAHHTVMTTAIRVEVFQGFRGNRRDRTRGHRRGHHGASLPARTALEPGLLPAGPVALTEDVQKPGQPVIASDKPVFPAG